MRFSIIIPTYNRSTLLARTLKSVGVATAGTSGEVLVVDNGSTDETAAVVTRTKREFDGLDIRYVFEPAPGLLSGRHRGALEARGDLLVFIDDDIRVGDGWLLAIEKAFADPKVQIVGGRYLPEYECTPPDWVEGFWSASPNGVRVCPWLSLLDFGETAMDVDPTYVWGLGYGIRRRALFELGGFNPDSMPDALQCYQGDGETGLSYKARSRGYRAVYEPQSVIYHFVPCSRMTPKYFERRAYFQGVCDSYTEIRGTAITVAGATKRRRYDWYRSVGPIARRLAKGVRRALNCHRADAKPVTDSISARGEPFRAILQSTEAAYRAGYEFHQKAVADDPELRAWVLREHYWDYRVPAGGRLN